MAQADPGRLPPAGLVQLDLEPGRGAPARDEAALIPDPNFPGITAAADQRPTGIGDVFRRRGPDPATVPPQILPGRDLVLVRRDQHLVGALDPVRSPAFEPPAEPDAVGGDGERVGQVGAAQPGWAQPGWA